MKEVLTYIVEYLLPRKEYEASQVGKSVVVPAGASLVKLPEQPPGVVFHTSVFADVGSLAAWLLKWSSAAECHILVDVDAGVVSARGGEQVWSDHVTAKFTPTVEYKTIRALGELGRPVSQEEAYRVLGRLRHVLVDSAKVLGQLARLEVKTKGTFAVGVDPRTGARTAKVVDAGAEYPVDIPTEIAFQTAIHNGSSAKFAPILDVSLVLSGTTPMLEFSLRNAAEVEQGSIREEVHTNLIGKLGDGWLVGYGQLRVVGSKV